MVLCIKKKIDNNKYWQRCSDIRTLVYYWWECKMVYTSVENGTTGPPKNKQSIAYDLVIQFMGIYLKELKAETEIFVHEYS